MIDTFWTNYKNISNIKIYFYPRSFRILAFIFTSVIHFEFNFNVYFEVRVDIFLFVDISNWSTTIYWENSPLATELFCLNYYVWNQMTIYAWSTFEPLILFHWSICVSFHKYHCLDYCKNCWKSWNLCIPVLFFYQLVLAIQGPLYFPITFELGCQFSSKIKLTGILNRILYNL